MVVTSVERQTTSTFESSRVIFTSIAAEDGFIGEYADSNTGGWVNSTRTGAMALRIGDNDFDRQLKSILSFDTSSVPDDAVILSAKLEMTRGLDVGENAFRSHGINQGYPYVDIKNGFFGNTSDLEKNDFETPADARIVATGARQGCQYDIISIDLSRALNCINAIGRTQIRLYFARDDDEDQQADYVGFYSSENSVAERHPKLIINYGSSPN